MNDEDVWIVGYYGKIYHSRDGGKQWYRQDAGTTNALLGIDFVSENDGWAVGELGKAAKSGG